MGAGGALLEVSGLPPAGAAVFRAALPAPGSEETPAVVLDTAAPAGGEVVEWLVDDENLAVRGALGLPAYGTLVAHDTAGLARLGCTWLHVCVHMVAGALVLQRPAKQLVLMLRAQEQAIIPGHTRTIHARPPA